MKKIILILVCLVVIGGCKSKEASDRYKPIEILPINEEDRFCDPEIKNDEERKYFQYYDYKNKSYACSKYYLTADGFYYDNEKEDGWNRKMDDPTPDIDSFTLFTKSIARDKNNIYTTWKKNEEILFPSSFTPFSESYFAKDKENIYMTYMYEDLTYIMCPNINYDTFEIIGANYTKDKDYVYLNCEIIAEANPKTFNFIDIKNIDTDLKSIYHHAYYTKDKNSVFYENKKLEVADSNTFEILDVGDEYHNFGGDTDYIYINGELISGADPNTFKYVGNDYYKDKDFIYYFKHSLNIPKVNRK